MLITKIFDRNIIKMLRLHQHDIAYTHCFNFNLKIKRNNKHSHAKQSRSIYILNFLIKK